MIPYGIAVGGGAGVMILRTMMLKLKAQVSKSENSRLNSLLYPSSASFALSTSSTYTWSFSERDRTSAGLLDFELSAISERFRSPSSRFARDHLLEDKPSDPSAAIPTSGKRSDTGVGIAALVRSRRPRAQPGGDSANLPKLDWGISACRRHLYWALYPRRGPTVRLSLLLSPTQSTELVSQNTRTFGTVFLCRFADASAVSGEALMPQ
jgi:hypothetical protein